MTLASLFRSAPAPKVVPGGRHAAPGDELARVVSFRSAPGRHAAREDLDEGDAFAEDELDGDLLESLGFGYVDDDGED